MKYELNKYNLLNFLKAIRPKIISLVDKLGLPFKYEDAELGKYVDLQKDYENGSWDFRFRVPLTYFKQGEKEDSTIIKEPILFIVNMPDITLANEHNAKPSWICSLDKKGNIDINTMSEKTIVALRALRWIYESLKNAYNNVSSYDVDKFIKFATKWNDNPAEEVCMGISPGTACWHNTRPKR